MKKSKSPPDLVYYMPEKPSLGVGVIEVEQAQV